MKKSLLISLVFLCGPWVTGLKANPIYIPPPQVFLSEVYINSSSDWVIELEVYIPMQFLSGGNIDSIAIQSNSGRSKITYFPVSYHALFTISDSSLVSPILINPNADTLTVITYVHPGLPLDSTVYYHRLVFGYPNCEIPVLAHGQSICARERVWGNPLYFYLDNSPTLGLENDTIGATAILRGHFYDCHDSLITYSLNNYGFALYLNVEFYPDPLNPYIIYYPTLANFVFDGQGFYRTPVLARNYGVDAVCYLYEQGAPYGAVSEEVLANTSFFYNLQPGQTLDTDIHLTDCTYLVGYSKAAAPDEDLTVVCSPNPMTTASSLYISSERKWENLTLKIFDLTGKTLKTLILPDALSASVRISREELGGGGTYIYTLFEKNRKVRSGYITCE